MRALVFLLFTAIISICYSQQATAHLTDANGASAGIVNFRQSGDTVVIMLDSLRLPDGVYSIHIHEKGECVGPNFNSAGAHFNPTNKKHGFLSPDGPHAGDLPNITITNSTVMPEQIKTRLVSLKKNVARSLLKPDGTALVVHRNPDDYITAPSGGSGERIACGVVKSAGNGR
jgi:Cu-Zn family superoxide dismutase